jgi:hypothetical protein
MAAEPAVSIKANHEDIQTIPVAVLPQNLSMPDDEI